MPVSTERKEFSEERSRRAEVAEPLPRAFRAAKNPCVAFVDAHPRSGTNATWFELWAGAVAIDALCVDQGKAGMSWGMGK